MSQFDERAFWLAIRQALLMMVDAIEQRLQMPRTSEVRKQDKETIPLAPLQYLVFKNIISVNSPIKEPSQLSYRDCQLLIEDMALEYAKLRSSKNVLRTP